MAATTKFFKEFFHSEKILGTVLIVCTLTSLLLANSFLGDRYSHIWHTLVGGHPLEFWINDCLMAIFFLHVGLELKREFILGELSTVQTAILPMIAAIGGVIVPASIYFVLNHGLPSQSGAGIPMATDIAFAIGVLSLLGSKVPIPLKIMLTALAVMDDLCAIIVIAIFYTTSLSFANLLVSLIIFLILMILNRNKFTHLWVYIVGGIIMWYFMLHSGIHATISGVLLAFAIPFRRNRRKSLSHKVERQLHQPVSFFIMPLFALANTCIVIESGWHSNLLSTSSLGIIAGLVLGKPIGIFLASLLSIKSGMCKAPRGLRMKHILGIGFLGGIGFTMSIFVTLLAFDDIHLIINAKIAILIASTLSAIIGYTYLSKILKPEARKEEILNEPINL